jgi:hypothetical protein
MRHPYLPTDPEKKNANADTISDWCAGLTSPQIGSDASKRHGCRRL